MDSSSAVPAPSKDPAADEAYLTSANELSGISSAFAEDAEVIAGLESLLSAQLGVDVRHDGSDAIIPPTRKLERYIRSRRTQSRHWLRVAEGATMPPRFARSVRDGRLSVFLKASGNIRNLAVDAHINGFDVAGARLPYYFGSFAAAGRKVAVWEAVDGEHVTFDRMSPEQQRNLVEAIAGLNAIPAGDLASVLPPLTRWVVAPFEDYEEAFAARDPDQREKWRSVLPETEKLVRDGALAERVRALGGGLLTHNDINPNNIFFMASGDVAVFDWEGATLGFAGADLRLLTRLEASESLLDCYVDRINALGVAVSRQDVLAGYTISEGMRRVYKGWRAGNLGPVLNGLALVRNVLDR